MPIVIILSVLIVVTIIVVLAKNKVIIDIVSFFKKGFSAYRGIYGVYCFCGKQGTGKTFATVNFILKNLDKPIYSNVHLKDIEYTHFDGFEQMLKINDHHCIIVFDEIFSALAKTSRIDPEIMSFLSQQRKKEVIFITTAQEWMEIPMTLRRYVRYQIDCSIFNILPFSILVERYRDGEQMRWDNLENDYVAPIIKTKITKMAKQTTGFYDTFEVIGSATSAPSGAVAAPKRSIPNPFNKVSDTPIALHKLYSN